MFIPSDFHLRVRVVFILYDSFTSEVPDEACSFSNQQSIELDEAFGRVAISIVFYCEGTC